MTTVDVSFNGYSVKESDGSITMDIMLNAAASQDITIVVTSKDGLAAGMWQYWLKYYSNSLFSIAGSDYGQTGVSSPLTSTVTIPSGELFASFSVNIIDDIIPEQNETFFITINVDPQHRHIPILINGDHSFTITIIDDEGNDIPVCW